MMLMDDSVDCILEIDGFTIKGELQMEVGRSSLDGSSIRGCSRSGCSRRTWRGSGCRRGRDRRSSGWRSDTGSGDPSTFGSLDFDS
jgi:hypothetical protein